MTRLTRCDRCGYEENDTPKYMKGRTFREIIPKERHKGIKHMCSICDGIDDI